jgi:hypothetical protein
MGPAASKVVSFPQASEGSAEHSHIQRWVRAELFGKGYLPVPALFLNYYSQLKPPLNSGEALFVLQVMSHKWDAKLPYPGYKTIAKRRGITESMARTHARSLKTMHYLRIIPRLAQTNRFDFRPLFDALAVVIEADAKKKEKKKEKDEIGPPLEEVGFKSDQPAQAPS